MKILAIDTSAHACSVAVSHNGKIFSSHVIAPMQQTKLILPTIKVILEDANLNLNQLDALAFGCGPGSFTGIRIATSVMQGLAYATAKPLIAISSLAAAAQASLGDNSSNYFLVAMDAKIQEVYWGLYQVQSGLVRLVGEEHVGSPESVLIPQNSDWLAVGSAWKTYSAMHSLPKNADSERIATAEAIITLAGDKFHKKEWLTPENAQPTYLRNNVAKKRSQQ